MVSLKIIPDKRPFIVLILISFQLFSNAQITLPGKPFRNSRPNSLHTYEIHISQSDREKALLKRTGSILKPAESGLLIPVNYTPLNSGNWETLPNGSRIWRAVFHVEGATMINLIFSPYQLNKGVRLFLYNPSQTSVVGALSDKNNKTINTVATAQIPCDSLVVEMQVPSFLNSYGTLQISGIGCDFLRHDSDFIKDGWYGESGDCNIDVSCINDTLVRKIKKSVVRIIYDGTTRCTGTLINTNNVRKTNYILTAGHCFTNESDANSAVFYFNYESPYCDGPDNNSLKTISGSTIRATSKNLDFALLEVFEPIPFTYKPYYAGWDYSGNIPSSAIGIHHPLGDVKKISIEEHPLLISDIELGYDFQTHWRVRHWEAGTTEAGSSGSPLFNNKGRVIGTLSGGYANCYNSVNDYYQMFSHSWNDYKSAENQLSIWLDPLRKSIKYIDGFDPYREFWNSGDTLSNIANEELNLERGSLSWGSYSGHNSEYISGYADNFTASKPKKIYGLLLHVADNYVEHINSSIHVKIWSGTNLPENVIYEKTVPQADLAANFINFIEFDSVVNAGQSFFAGFELEYNTPQDTFSVYMAKKRTTGFNTAYLNDNLQWKTLSEKSNNFLNSSYAIFPVVFDTLPGLSNEDNINDDVIVYPNPANNLIWLQFKEAEPLPVIVTIANVQGQVYFKGEYDGYQHLLPFDLNNYAQGIYIINIKRGNRIYNLKISVLK